MRKTIALWLALVLCLLTAACAQQVTPPEAEYPMELIFSSGAGAWRTTLTLNADGSFRGQYSDANMGETGEGYPNGTVYLCSFSGRFSFGKRLDVHSYPLTLEEITLDRPAGEEWIEDGVLYVSAGPHGLEGGTEFMLYDPTSPILGLDEEFLSWWPARFEPVPPEILCCWGLWNVETGTGFYTDILRASTGVS